MGLGHQASFLFTKRYLVQPGRSWLGELILKVLCSCKSSGTGFTSKHMTKIYFEPVIRCEIRNAIVENKGHYTVYLPAFGDQKIIEILSQIKDVQWQVFSKRCHKTEVFGNIKLSPIDNFISSLTGSSGILTSAGFETPAEALFLGKKVACYSHKTSIRTVLQRRSNQRPWRTGFS